METEELVAYRLPALYRDALDAIAALQHGSDRTAAARLRREAQATYALRWDEDACRRLVQLAARARTLAEEPPVRRTGATLRPAWLRR